MNKTFNSVSNNLNSLDNVILNRDNELFLKEEKVIKTVEIINKIEPITIIETKPISFKKRKIDENKDNLNKIIKQQEADSDSDISSSDIPAIL
jgi:hypothetical protein